MIHLHSDRHDLLAPCLAFLKQSALDILKKQEHCFIALAGGNSPKNLYKEWAKDSDFPWHKIILTLTDERYVDENHTASNARMIRECGLAEKCAAFFPYPLNLPYENICDALEKTLPFPVDIAFLGLGNDGHTASVFPSDPKSFDDTRYTVTAQSPVEPRQRISLSLKTLRECKILIVYTPGQDKIPAVASLLSPTSDSPVALLAGDKSVTLFSEYMRQTHLSANNHEGSRHA